MCTSSLRLSWTPLSPHSAPHWPGQNTHLSCRGCHSLCTLPPKPGHPGMQGCKDKSPSPTKSRASERINLTMVRQGWSNEIKLPPGIKPQQGLHCAPAPQGCHILTSTPVPPPCSPQEAPPAPRQAGRPSGYSMDIPIPRLCPAVQPQKSIPMAPEGSKTPTQSRSSSSLALICDEATPKSLTLNAMASNCSLQFDSDIT